MRTTSLLLLSLLAGCELIRPPTQIDLEEDHVQVHAMLWAGSDTAMALVEEVGVEGMAARTRPVSGARIRISNPVRGVALREAPAGFRACVERYDFTREPAPKASIGPGCYAGILPAGARSGESYTLSITLPDGRQVAGRTTVPFPPELVTPAAGARLRTRRIYRGNEGIADSLVLRWRVRQGGMRAHPVVLPGAVYRQGEVVSGGRCELYLVGMDHAVLDARLRGPRADSLRARLHVDRCRLGSTSTAPALRPDSLEAFILITAFDSAYTTYAEDTERVLNSGAGSGIREGRASAGLTGAYGVFGSAATTRRRVMLVFSEP
jgi:hypothetical protein